MKKQRKQYLSELEELLALIYSKPLELNVDFVFVDICEHTPNKCDGIHPYKLYKCDSYGDFYEKQHESFTYKMDLIYKNAQDLHDSIFKKYNIKCDIAQIEKHVYSKDREGVNLYYIHSAYLYVKPFKYNLNRTCLTSIYETDIELIPTKTYIATTLLL